MGLGDVYLGAPVATPVDPRHRLVTTKYNPARTWTPPNVVGIGGAYMCIYGMEGPGGYQLFGRTIQVWNTWRQTDAFVDGKPWLLRFFDQVRFFPVSAEELVDWRRDFPLGRRQIRIEEEVFRLSDYRKFLADNADSIGAFQATRQAAFDAERADWQAKGEFDRVAELSSEADASVAEVAITAPEGCDLIEAPLGGSVWKMLVKPGDRIEKGAVLAIIEAMKTGVRRAEPFGGCGPRGLCRRAPGDLRRRPDDRPGARVMRARTIAADVASGATTAEAVARDALARVAAYDAVQPQAWIERAAPDVVLARAREVDAQLKAGAVLPLAGVPFAVKDNIDAAGLPTTAACPAFAYRPEASATVVARLEAAGAILIGKTNLDQFATGLVGTRSPYGQPACVFNRAYVSGGSSSGSAVATAAGLVAFAPGHRHRRLGPGACRVQWPGWPEAHQGPLEHDGPGPRLPLAGRHYGLRE